MNEVTYTGPQVAEFAGVDYRTLYNWVKRGLITPSIREANGSGKKAIYSFEDRIQAGRMGRLVAAGFSLELAARLSADSSLTFRGLQLAHAPDPALDDGPCPECGSLSRLNRMCPACCKPAPDRVAERSEAGNS